MKKNYFLSNRVSNFFLFNIKGSKKISQDTIYHSRISKNINNKKKDSYYFKQNLNSFYFENFIPKKSFFLCENPLCYIRNNSDSIYIDKLRKGRFIPEIVLDLHGLNIQQAKKELGYLISICHKENFFCASIIHGYGKNILKKNVPFWLSMHPDIIAFHRAPRTLGYDTAIIILIKSSF